ncbi:MAG TPA: VWA domain-containing protein [Blastocatellia bacterium]|nr:VWA domain-containing protein [Blastocatellia bacterium]HMX24475.1 VWA domain-containing protein [Blastocatellia bacterium]HMZ16807.1 VWA domain-containing protein [Blastocatellia bacterium]HNG32277.1 VWA domain-containing protein [Blastocatellia bacterium]
MVTLLHPIWLALAIPLLVAWWVWKPSSKFVRHARLATLLLILPALCGLAVKLPSRAGTVVIVADRSLSMPANAEAAERETIELIQRAMSSDDRLAVVSFGQTAAIERSPQTGAFAGFANQISPDASNLSDAIEKALALIPSGSPGKILVISDGHWTGKEPAGTAARAASRGIAIDYRALQRSTANDLAIAQIDAPVTVTPGEGFMITAWVKSPVAQEINYELRRGGQTLAAGKTQVSAGLNRLTFRDLAESPGAQNYNLKISAAGNDPIPENNSAKILVGVLGPRPLLVVSSSESSGLARLLADGGLKLKVSKPEDCEWTLEWLAQYSGVLIENVQAEKITTRGMEALTAWVTETGAGLMMTGGKHAYGPGGYFKSPLEAVLPVSMELRQEHRKLSLAIVVAMDRSGSMAVPVGGGRTKMDLANLAAVQVLDLLSPNDEFGVVAVDSSSHIIADLKPIENNASRIRNDVLKVDSGGGGIFIFEALGTSAEMLLKAKAGTRHIILFADAADSEEPGSYRELLKQCEQAGITVSVIGLGKPSDSDAYLLRDIAARGNGQIYFTESAEELPRLFAQDTIVVARSTFLEAATPIQPTGGLVTLTGKQFTGLPAIGGYNLCYLRPNANLATVTTDEYGAPVVASWQAGSGRVLTYTGEADGDYTGAIAGWKDAGDYFTSLARWTAGDTANLPGNMLLTQEVKNGVSRIQLHLDPERDENGQDVRAPKVNTLRGVPGSKPASEKAELRWTDADTMEVSIPLNGSETALSTVEIPGASPVTLAPVTLPYSPEFKPADSAEGQAALGRLALATGGKERLELAGVWKDLPRQQRLIELAPWLLLTAILLLLLEVLERHSGLLTAGVFPKLQAKLQRKPKSESVPIVTQPVSKPAKAPATSQVESLEPAQSTEPAAIFIALQQARQKAKERNDR